MLIQNYKNIVSNHQTVKYKCYQCGEEFECDTYDSANVTLDPDLREKVIDGSLFNVICPKCQYKSSSLNPFVYYDEEHKFMVLYDYYENLLDHKEDIAETNLSNEIKVIGVTSHSELVTSIICMENKLDYRVMQIALLATEYGYIKYCLDNKIKIGFVEYSALTGNKTSDDELEVILLVNTEEGGKTYYSSIPKNLYDLCYERYIERLNQINPFVFDKNMRQHFCDFYEEDFLIQEKHKSPYYYVEIDQDTIVICFEANNLDNMSNAGDTVIVEFFDGTRTTGKIKRKVYWNFLGMPLNNKELGKITCKSRNFTIKITNRKNDQDNSLKALIHLKESNYELNSKTFPTEELRKLKLIICLKSSEGYRTYNEIKSDSAILKNVQKVFKGEGYYLTAYADDNYLPAQKETLNIVCGFDDLVRIVKNDTNYCGIIVNQYNEDIVLDFETIKTYIQFRTLTNKEELKKLLDDLNDIEIKEVTEKSYNFIRNVYFDGLDVKALCKEYHLSKKEVGKILDRGYIALKDIVFARF